VEAFLRLYSSVHRGAGYASAVSTAAYEQARQQIARFAGAGPDDVAVLTRNTTDALNLLAGAVPGRVVHLDLEHHANLLPWRRRTAVAARSTVAGTLAAVGAELAREPAALLTVTGASNVTGECLPLAELAELAHRHGARLAVDAAQLVPHRVVDMAGTGIDYLAFSGHKLYAPYGAGVLIGRRDWLDAARPYLAGGGAVRRVTLGGASWADSDARILPSGVSRGGRKWTRSRGAVQAWKGTGVAVGFVSLSVHEPAGTLPLVGLAMITRRLLSRPWLPLIVELRSTVGLRSGSAEGLAVFVTSTPWLAGPMTVESGLVSVALRLPARAYQTSTSAAPGNPSGVVNSTSTLPLPGTVAATWQGSVLTSPELPAATTIARPARAATCESMCRSTSMVPSCGPIVPPRLMLTTTGFPKASGWFRMKSMAAIRRLAVKLLRTMMMSASGATPT